MHWGAEKVEEKAHSAKETIKSGVDKIVPQSVKDHMNKLVYEARGLNISTVSKMVGNALKG